MPRNMSFAMTTEQFRNRTKRVTRRLGWWHLKHHEQVMGVEKTMGLRRGERITRLGLIVIESTWAEPLEAITQDDVILEGFPQWTPADFIEFFCRHGRIRPDQKVNRIQFDYVD